MAEIPYAWNKVQRLQTHTKKYLNSEGFSNNTYFLIEAQRLLLTLFCKYCMENGGKIKGIIQFAYKIQNCKNLFKQIIICSYSYSTECSYFYLIIIKNLIYKFEFFNRKCLNQVNWFILKTCGIARDMLKNNNASDQMASLKVLASFMIQLVIFIQISGQ